MIKGIRRRLVDLGNVEAPDGPLNIQLMIFNKEHIPLIMEQLKKMVLSQDWNGVSIC